MLDSLINKVTGFQAGKFIKKRLQHRFFPVTFTKFLRTPILRNIWKRLPLTDQTESNQRYLCQKKLRNYLTKHIRNVFNYFAFEIFVNSPNSMVPAYVKLHYEFPVIYMLLVRCYFSRVALALSKNVHLIGRSFPLRIS